MDNTTLADLSEWREHGESDLSEMSPELREAVIREHFKGNPWMAAFAIDVQGVYNVTDLDDIERDATDAFQGEYDSLEDYAANYVEDAYSESLEALSSFIRYNIDYAAIGRDFVLGGDIYTIDSNGYEPDSYGIYVFNSSW